MIKELVLQATKELSDNATIEEILDAILVKLSIQRGCKDFEEGKVITHEELLKEIETW